MRILGKSFRPMKMGEETLLVHEFIEKGKYERYIVDYFVDFEIKSDIITRRPL